MYLELYAILTNQDVSDFPVERIVYVMTDFTENNFNFWAEHPVRRTTTMPYYDTNTMILPVRCHETRFGLTTNPRVLIRI